MKKIAILQSNYIPWKGYFDLMAYVDEFVIYDDVQYTKNDWRNRNRIKTPSGVQWITIPVSQGLDQRIMDVVVTDPRWRTKHWKTLEANYRKAPFFSYVEDMVGDLYTPADTENLSDINVALIRKIADGLGVRTRISSSSDYVLEGGRNQRLVNLCIQTGADCYVSGPAAKSYIEVEDFEKLGLSVEWFNYSGYPKYPQLWGDFAHDVTVLDLLFNTGPNSAKYMRFLR